MKTAKRLLQLLRPLKGTMLLSATAGIIGHLCAIGIMSAGALLLCSVMGYAQPVSQSLLITLLFIFAVLRGVLRYLEQYTGHDVAFRLLALLREQTFAALRRLAPAKTAGRHSADLNAAIVADVELIEVFFAHTVAPVLIAVGVSTVVLAFAATFGWIFPLLIGGFYAMTLLVSYIVSSRAGKHQGRDYRQAFAENSSRLLDHIYGLKEILIFGRQTDSLRQIEEGSHRLSRPLDRQRLLKSIAAAWPEAVITLTGMATFAVAVNSGLALDRTILLTVTVLSSFGPITSLSLLTVDLSNTFAAAERIFAILDEKPAAGEDMAAPPAEIASPAALLPGSVHYDHVNFRYPGSPQPVLEDFSLGVRPGDKTALVGPSGCGKSTALHLLLRYYDCDQGVIYAGEQDIRSLPLTALRSHIAMLTQSTFLFDDTIAANIKLGKPGATDEEMRTAARRAMIAPFIEGLPDGYGTRVGELGDKLSGGERQRIGIARVLLSDASIIVLDEPTSNLDALNEQGLLSLLRKELSDRTVIMVSHRPAAVEWADRTLRLKARHGA
ncbi:thiol reductant ABC exporter subunit CydC [Paenibacillus sp. HW567]|uniref:thiol reductant ABC exporter subunit CydC n=1 Tax=Paenibacillus sp. HW567 TaxID=1034769 RepID=UPI00035C68B8|nr:thiol reductant ABC exporter subunit CydC [Paenibacillus sp. HW567]